MINAFLSWAKYEWWSQVNNRQKGSIHVNNMRSIILHILQVCQMSELPIFSHGCQWLLHSYLPQNTCFQGSSTWHDLHSTQKNAWPPFTNHMSHLVSTLETQPVTRCLNVFLKMRQGPYLLSAWCAGKLGSYRFPTQDETNIYVLDRRYPLLECNLT